MVKIDDSLWKRIGHAYKDPIAVKMFPTDKVILINCAPTDFDSCQSDDTDVEEPVKTKDTSDSDSNIQYESNNDGKITDNEKEIEPQADVDIPVTESAIVEPVSEPVETVPADKRAEPEPPQNRA
ncbi:hypothetical protein SARC_03619 [Sphaeroforma arctica JP610]|uniref:Uncharacterized protein n=1 Tax=Sphaeroforma arctica JP610 TaxID=667725 RepID=A0A0L0G7G9_9EUKA|nr:hypothetical protein SARC_03619 [Sphaeroforma arctica JP610]KNC84163.1 hypothetical protein SARC_03619 [Sphaeroforma arctica JP610]|eukprot:XP_014158065.1 hypothetical protein SARC_03619 [Sphaeroforma arctica JP610]